MEELDSKKIGDEIAEIEKLPPVSIEISPLHVCAVITLLQVFAIEKPQIADDGWGKIGIEAARPLQNQDFFNQYPEICKLIETGWHPEWLVTPETVAYMLLDIDAAMQQNEVSDKDGNAGSSETAAKRIARSLLESQGFKSEGLELETTATCKPEQHWIESNEHIAHDRFDENFYHGKTFSERCRDEGIDPCDDLY